jgi:ASCH domain
VVSGYKDIENRSWRTAHRGPLLVHASRSKPDYTSDMIERMYGVRLPDEVETGGIIGLVDVVDCVKRHSSKWKFRGTWGWVLENPRRLPLRECKGFVGLFKPEF